MKLINLFPSWMVGGGIFNYLNDAPWESETTVNKTALDLEYFGNRSGNKEISVLLDKMVAPDSGKPLTEVEIGRICSVIKTMFFDKWKKLWDAFLVEYNPIENYSMTQTETPNITRSHTYNITRTDRVETNTNITNDTETTTDITNETSHKADSTTTTLEGVKSLGASDYAPATKHEEQTEMNPEDNVDTTHITGDGDENKVSTTVQGDASDNFTYRSGGETNGGTESETGTRQLTRSGNIGVTTSQQMLQSEIELRRWLYFGEVFKDMDSVLTSPVYRSDI